MRCLLKVSIPVETGNVTIGDGTLPKTIESILNELKLNQGLKPSERLIEWLRERLSMNYRAGTNGGKDSYPCVLMLDALDQVAYDLRP